PIRSVPDLPPALNSLIMQLLNLDRSARPQNAAEVMERLCAIAGLPMEERIEVTRAYLSTPVLVGREKTLLAVRKRMLSLVRGDGAQDREAQSDAGRIRRARGLHTGTGPRAAAALGRTQRRARGAHGRADHRADAFGIRRRRQSGLGRGAHPHAVAWQSARDD